MYLCMCMCGCFSCENTHSKTSQTFHTLSILTRTRVHVQHSNELGHTEFVHVHLSHRDPVVIIMPLQRLPVFKTHSLTIRYGYTMNLQKDTCNTTKPHRHTVSVPHKWIHQYYELMQK